MRKKQVAVVGNCQAAFTAKLYREFFGAPNHEDVCYVDDYALDNEAAWAAVGQADLVLLQQRDFSSPLVESAPPDADVYTFPLVLEAFLWPYAHEPHVRNRPEPPLSEGPYPAQLGDKFLNRMITQGVSPEAALEQYLAHDIAGATHIDRLYELHLDQQRERDQRTGFDIASVLEADFRRKALFMSPHHPHAWMFGVFLSQLFNKMGLDSDVIQTMAQSLRSSPFPSGELPIHPGVIKHFGLEFADENTRYMFHDEGRFSFAEHVLRYMRYEHNHELRTGMHYFHSGDIERALPYLEGGLETSPTSTHGWRAKGLIMGRLSRAPESVEPFRRAIAASPSEPEAYAELARTLMEVGSMGEALDTARKAVAIAPYHWQSQLVLAELLFRANDYPGAVEAGGAAVRLAPAEAYCCWWAALARWHSGDTASARTYCERALHLEPNAPDPRNLLAEIFEKEGRRDDAIAILEEGITIEGANDQTFSLVGNLHLRKALFGDERQREPELKLALKAFKRGLEIQPNRHEFKDQIQEMNERLDALA